MLPSILLCPALFSVLAVPPQQATPVESSAETPSARTLQDKTRRQADLFYPGLVTLSFGATWLTASAVVWSVSVLSLDWLDPTPRSRQERFTKGVLLFHLPVSILITGAVMTGLGQSARSRQRWRRSGAFVRPHFERAGGGLSVGARF
ncbi:MAG: hypothetical protein KUG77_00455 [Nannocystaceae bacterium]|nr:hypothetical protein [Nannocystaceae bacterium]